VKLLKMSTYLRKISQERAVAFDVWAPEMTLNLVKASRSK
jgi:hypothetical protein